MRSMWKGAISFGLVNIPVRMYTATEDRSISFNYLHQVCHTPVRYAKICPSCNREVTQEEIVRGYNYEKGRYIEITEDDLASIPLMTQRAVEILDFIDLNEIDPILFHKSYYLEPDASAAKPYFLLHQAMRQSGKVAIAKIAIRSRESICCIRVYQNALSLVTMIYPDEVRSLTHLSGIETAPAVSAAELDMAGKLITSLTTPFTPEKYQDEYRQALATIINNKIAGNEVHEAPTPDIISTNVADLMAALEASLQAIEEEKQPAEESKANRDKRRDFPALVAAGKKEH
jgi:DNA end-binding protein Ku